MTFVIYNRDEKLFWKNDDGWTVLVGADEWEIAQLAHSRLPLGGVWVDKSVADLLPQED